MSYARYTRSGDPATTAGGLSSTEDFIVCWGDCIEKARFGGTGLSEDVVSMIPPALSALPKALFGVKGVSLGGETPGRDITNIISFLAGKLKKWGIIDHALPARRVGGALSKVFTPLTIFEGFFDWGVIYQCGLDCDGRCPAKYDRDMVDREGRNQAIDAIRRFRDRQMTNNVFVDAYPGSRTDAGIRAISDAIWFFYDDVSEHRLDGDHALSPQALRGFNRCIVFLATDQEYTPEPGLIRRTVAAVAGRHLQPGTSRRSPVWPFPSWDAYRKAVEELGSARAGERGVGAEYQGALDELGGPPG
jgi:hypothetical protein